MKLLLISDIWNPICWKGVLGKTEMPMSMIRALFVSLSISGFLSMSVPSLCPCPYLCPFPCPCFMSMSMSITMFFFHVHFHVHIQLDIHIYPCLCPFLCNMDMALEADTDTVKNTDGQQQVHQHVHGQGPGYRQGYEHIWKKKLLYRISHCFDIGFVRIGIDLKGRSYKIYKVLFQYGLIGVGQEKNRWWF